MSKQLGLFSNVKGDLSSGLVVFLIAVPLCLGIALASGAPLFSGMIAGIVGGIVIGGLSGSQLSVSGPAAGLTAIVLAGIMKLGAFDIFLLAVALAGVLQLILGLVKAGSVANYFPSNVINGMLTAIGIIIILKQIKPALGIPDDGGYVWNLLHPAAIAITVISILVLVYWQKIPKLNMIPAPLAAVLIGVGINAALISLFPSYGLQQAHLVNLPVSDSFSNFIGQFTLPDFTQIGNKDVWIMAITIAVVASIETLLNLEATDKLDPLKRYSSPNRELRAQGVGNLISGLIGGLPVTSVIVRSSANINAGGRTKLAAISHGFLLLICAATIPMLLNMIPLATLAAVLLVTGWKLCKPSVFKKVIQKGKYHYIPFLVTVVTIVATDLLVGVGVGVAVSILFVMWGNIKSPYFFKKEKYRTGDYIELELSQEVSFLNKANILLTLDRIPEKTTVLIDASKTVYIDQDVLEIIREFTQIKAPSQNIKVILKGFKEAYKIDNTDHLFVDLPTKEKPIIPTNAGNHKELLKQLSNN
jgi:MFS superfamily sulfate permease-like transporter